MAGGPITASESDLLAQADDLASAGEYEDAITEYKRFAFFHQSDDRISLVQMKIGKVYWELGDQDRAFDQFLKAVDSASSDQARDEMRINLAVLYLASADYSSAEATLLRVKTFSTDETSQRRAIFLLAITYLYRSRWDEAQDELHTYFKGRSGAELDRLNDLLSPARRPHNKSRRLARQLSTVIPGAGQIYAGNLGDGINALCVNLFFGLPLKRTLADRRVLDVTIELPQFLRYYNGNRNNAEALVDKYNDRRNRSYAARVIELVRVLVDHEEGKLPLPTQPEADR